MRNIKKTVETGIFMDKTIDDKSMCNHNYGKQNQPLWVETLKHGRFTNQSTNNSQDDF